MKNIIPLLMLLPAYLSAAPCVDSDGDGWGWDGQNSCRTATPVCIDDDYDGWGWDGSNSCSVTSSTSGTHYQGVTDEMWAEIELARRSFGDANNCRVRVNDIPSEGYELSPCAGNCINEALKRNNVVKLLPGNFLISETIKVTGKKLIGAHPTRTIIDASNVDEAVKVDNYAIASNFSVYNARDVGVRLGDLSTLYRLSINGTGQSSYFNSRGNGVMSSGGRGNCIVSVDASNGYNENGRDCATCYNGGNADGFTISSEAGNNTLIDSHASRNSDDGIDFWQSSSSNFIYFSSAFYNGKPTDGRQAGNGNGFKLGRGNTRHFLYKSIAYNNLRIGFDANGNSVSPRCVGCIAYDNAPNWVGIERIE